MCWRNLALSLSTLLLVVCSSRTTGVVVESVMVAANHGYLPLDSLSGKHGLRLEINPTPFPQSLSVGDRLLVDAKTLLSNGTQCKQCTVRWQTSDRNVAYWTDPETPCPNERCALLRALAPGQPMLVVEVCPGASSQEECSAFKIGEPEICLKSEPPSLLEEL